MGKGQITKEHIIRQSAGLFNTRGYMGTSLSEIMDRCNVRKGGIYNHFGSKDEIALAAFDYSFAQLKSKLNEALKACSTPAGQIVALCDVYIQLAEGDPCEGGCPILNTAIESDDGHPLLRERAQLAMKELMSSLEQIVREGIRQRQFRSDLQVEAACSVIIALIQGGVVLSKLYDDSTHIRRCTEQVKAYVKGSLTD